MNYTVNGNITDDKIHLELGGHVDSANAEEVRAAIFAIADQAPGLPAEVDAEHLNYISSAGLRVLLQLRKKNSQLRVYNVNSEIYEIFDVTGFNQMMDVQKAYKVVSVDGCEVIGKGANGTIYRIDMDNVVKVYNNADALDDIQHEREVARLALVLGIPTAISYDVVKVGDSYGSVFELLNATAFFKILAREPERMDWCVEQYTELLKLIHNTEVPEGKLPDMKKTALNWANFTKDYLPEEAGAKLMSLIEAVPASNMMIHGDYHTGNVELTGDEVLLIDMDTLAVGDPVFEFGSIFNALIGFSERDNSIIEKFQGYDQQTADTFWHKVLAAYFETDDEDEIRAAEDKARIIGYTRLIRRSIRRGGLENEEMRADIDYWHNELIELIDRVDSLSLHI